MPDVRLQPSMLTPDSAKELARRIKASLNAEVTNQSEAANRRRLREAMDRLESFVLEGRQGGV